MKSDFAAMKRALLEEKDKMKALHAKLVGGEEGFVHGKRRGGVRLRSC